MLTKNDFEKIAKIFDIRFKNNFDKFFDKKFAENFDKSFDKSFDKKFAENFDKSFDKSFEKNLFTTFRPMLQAELQSIKEDLKYLKDKVDRIWKAESEDIDMAMNEIDRLQKQLDLVKSRVLKLEKVKR